MTGGRPARPRTCYAATMTDHHTERDPSSEGAYPPTPDGRYFVVRGRLRQLSNPALLEEERAALVAELMAARRAVRAAARDAAATAVARLRVDAAKVALGERGPVWWDDGGRTFIGGWSRGRPMASGMRACPDGTLSRLDQRSGRQLFS